MKNPILVVNDDSKILSEMTSLLKEGNIFHIAASSGKQALTLASGYDFSLVVLDLKLADMDGDELYLKLVERESHYELPILGLVDTFDSEEIEVVNRLLPLGQITLLSKPLNHDRLLDLFERYGEKNTN